MQNSRTKEFPVRKCSKWLLSYKLEETRNQKPEVLQTLAVLMCWVKSLWKVLKVLDPHYKVSFFPPGTLMTSKVCPCEKKLCKRFYVELQNKGISCKKKFLVERFRGVHVPSGSTLYGKFKWFQMHTAKFLIRNDSKQSSF